MDDAGAAAVSPVYDADSPTMTVRDALNSAMAEEMERDPKVFIMGEEVGDYQGAYKITKGLIQRFGPMRVRDTPITEAGGYTVGPSVNSSVDLWRLKAAGFHPRTHKMISWFQNLR
jgi:pyruvate dehydrogenase E1 component beta subunit